MTSVADSNRSAISVAMATYNGKRYLQAQLESILEQTLMPLELVVGDDTSTDGTLEMLEDFARRAPFPVVILRNNPRKGVFDNFFSAFRNCKGEYIAYCDQDDVWHKEKLARCCAALVRHQAASVSHVSEVVDSQLCPTGQFIPTGFTTGVYPAPSFPIRYWRVGHQTVFKREMLTPMDRLSSSKRDGVAECGTNLDLLLSLAAGMWGPTVLMPDVLVKFRRHEQTATVCAKPVDGRESRDRFGERQQKLERWIPLMRGLIAFIDEEDTSGALGLSPVQKAKYLAHLRYLSKTIDSRLKIHTGQTMAQGASGLLTAVLQGAYKPQQWGGVGLKQGIADSHVLLSRLIR